MTGYCFDTDIISATLKPAPPLHLLRRLATVPAIQQFTTAITVGELIYGARRVNRPDLGRGPRWPNRICGSPRSRSARI